MPDFIHWPGSVLPPAEVFANLVPFSRSGGRSLGGIDRTARTDRGFWQITLDQVPVDEPAQRRTWNAIRTQLGGKVGLIAVPVWATFSAPYVSGKYEELVETTHDDGTTFSDGTRYVQGAIDVQMAAFAPLGSTIVTIRLVRAASPSGIRFSYQHGLYETGPIVQEIGDGVYQVRVFPSIRMPIPAGAQLEVDEPTCLCHLAEDRGMDQQEGISILQRRSVTFVEATDFWNDLALGRVA